MNTSNGASVSRSRESGSCSRAAAGKEQAWLTVGEIEDERLGLVREIEDYQTGLRCRGVVAQEGEIVLAVLVECVVVAADQGWRGLSEAEQILIERQQ
jgi:hypothetical protein